MRLREVKERLFVVVLMLFIVLSSLACSKGGNNVDPDPTEPDGTGVIIATFNVGYDNPSATSEKTWENRKDLVANVIKTHKFDVFGAQEPLFNQLEDIEDLLPNYTYFGRSRTGETNEGEFAPIFYNKETVEILESGQFWLTDQEDKTVPTVGWDARYPRTCVWVKVRHKTSNETFYVFNVHFDHIGAQARAESTKLIMTEVPRIAQGYPYFLLGDFNFDQNGANYHEIQGSSLFVDTYDIAERNINGQRGTFNSFNVNSTSTVRIDHIFVNQQNSPTISRHQIITDSFGGHVPSDHFPVMVEVEF